MVSHDGSLLRMAVIICLSWLLAAGCDNNFEVGDNDGDAAGERESTEQVPPFPCSFADDPREGSTAGEQQPMRGTLVILTADAHEQAARDWALYRSADYEVSVHLISEVLADGQGSLLHEGFEAAIQDFFRTHWVGRGQGPFFGLFLGDAEQDQPGVSWNGGTGEVPTGRVYDPYWDEWIASDAMLTDMDGDELPDFVTGRIPFKDPDQVVMVLDRIKAHEAGYTPGPWNKRFHLFAGTAGFGELEDAALEMAAYKICEDITYDIDVTMIYGSENSAFFYPPDMFSDKVYERINEGSLVTGYIGHGSTEDIDSVCIQTADKGRACYDILNIDERDKLAIQHRSPILLFIACLTGAFNRGESMAEKFLGHEQGVIGVVASTDVSHPVPNALLLHDLGKGMVEHRSGTLGGMLAYAREAILAADSEVHLELIGLAEQFGEPWDGLPEAHVHMYTLFGDPATKVRLPDRSGALALSQTTASGGDRVDICAFIDKPGVGEAVLTYELSRSDFKGRKKSWEATDPDWRDKVQSNNRMANDKVLLSETIASVGGFETSIEIPKDRDAGTYWIKVFVEGDTQDAVLSAPIVIK